MPDDLVYLFTGDAEVFIQNRIDRIISSYHKYSYTVNKYDLEQTSISKVLEDCSTIPFFEELKVIVLKNPQILKQKDSTKEMESLIKYIKNPSDTTVLMINACNIKPSTDNPLYQALKKYAVIIDYSNDEEVELRGFVRISCEQRNTTITDAAIDLFLEYISNNQIRMVHELEKLIDYIGEDGEITEEHIKLLVAKDLSKEIYILISAIINHKKDEVRYIYDELSKETKDIYSIIYLITNTVKEMLQIKLLVKEGYTQDDIAKFFNTSRGRAYYLIQDAKKFELEPLQKSVVALYKLDKDIKSGKVDKNIGFELLLLKL